MREVSSDKIRDLVADLCIKANLNLRKDVLDLLKKSNAHEKSKRAKEALEAIIKNARIAKMERLAICQDTGMPVVFIEVGQEIKINGDLRSAVNAGVELGYRKAYLRNSIVPCPITRGEAKFSPVVIHTEIVRGNKIKIIVLPKGFGSENKSQLKCFKPTASEEEIKRFIVDSVKLAGADACPPYVVGVGIGGTADYACLLAKKALLGNLSRLNSPEKELLREINKLKIGPMGLGGQVTALAVKIMTYPTHIAGLPVAVNISCHALRSAKGEI